MITKELKNLSTTQRDLKNFGLLVGGVFIVIGIFVLKNFLHPLAIVGIILVILGMLKPILLKYVYLVWMAVALVMVWFVTRLILFIFFLFVITPFRIIIGFSEEKLIDTKINKKTKTYWTYRHSSNDYDSMLEKQF